MAEVILFNHIPKTAGSTMRYVLWRVVGRERVLTSTRRGEHRERIGSIGRQLTEGTYAVVAHTGFGVQDYLPSGHDYSTFTILRDPVERTLSRYRMALHDNETEGSLEDYLKDDLVESYNAQTAFLGGLTARHHLEGEALRPDQYNQALLERAKRNLESHDAFGTTERFEEILLLLRDRFGWPMAKLLHTPANVRAGSQEPTSAELEAVRAHNKLDQELYDFAAELSKPVSRRRLRRFHRLNVAYGRIYPAARWLRSRRQ